MISQPKTHLGQYRLDAELGTGGMGVVFRATDEKLHREVAVKLLHTHLLKNTELKDRFHREARVHASLMHPNIVTLLSLYEEGEDVALIMEMVHGCDLKQYLKKNNPVPMKEVIRIAQSILAGLAAAHEAGLVHRDLKPANVLVSEAGEVKLVDFGLAKPTGGRDDLTQSGATVGSFRYMAPEQILHEDIDARTDLYAFGILLYQMLVGKPPFDATASGGGEFQIMEQQIRAIPKPPIEVKSEIPKTLSDLVLQLLEKDPDKRPISCRDVSQRLTEIAMQWDALNGGASQIYVQHTPVSGGHTQTQTQSEIARSLFSGLFDKVRDTVVDASKVVTYMPVKLGEVVAEKSGPTSFFHRQWTTWGLKQQFVISWFTTLILLGLLSFIMLPGNEPEQGKEVASKSSQPQLNVSSGNVEDAKDTYAQAILQQAEQATAEPESDKTPAVKEEKTVEKPEPAPVKKKTVVRNPATYTVGHIVKRSDYSVSRENESHEFRGGSRVYFEELKDYKWKESLHTFKTGKARLKFDKPVQPTSIIIRKASVGRKDFTEGYVQLDVQLMDGSWHQVFERRDDDVDIPVTISGKKLPKEIKGVRIEFKTPEPITVGPIDIFAR